MLSCQHKYCPALYKRSLLQQLASAEQVLPARNNIEKYALAMSAKKFQPSAITHLRSGFDKSLVHLNPPLQYNVAKAEANVCTLSSTHNECTSTIYSQQMYFANFRASFQFWGIGELLSSMSWQKMLEWSGQPAKPTNIMQKITIEMSLFDFCTSWKLKQLIMIRIFI